MKISIIGAGALGKAYGGLLSRNHQIHYLMRSEYQEILLNQGFILEFKNKNEIIDIRHPIIVNDPKLLPPSDIVIISLKTTENYHIRGLLEKCLQPNTIVLIIQNGIGNEEWISQFTQECPILCGISTMGARRKSPILVDISTIGELRVAPFKVENLPYCEVIHQAFQKSHIPLPVKITNNFKEIRWQKLLWNVPFSCLSIIYQKDARMLVLEPYLIIVQKIIDELVELAQTQNICITQDYVIKMLDFTSTLNGYYPSMYYDHIQGKKIEKEYILDNVLTIAKLAKKDTPTLNLIDAYLTQSVHNQYS